MKHCIPGLVTLMLASGLSSFSAAGSLPAENGEDCHYCFCFDPVGIGAEAAVETADDLPFPRADSKKAAAGHCERIYQAWVLVDLAFVSIW